jgi:hypothetical protein
MQAHEELVRIRPSLDASLTVWLEYYQDSVSLYELIAEVDPGHECEALYWARRERYRAEQTAAGSERTGRESDNGAGRTVKKQEGR